MHRDRTERELSLHLDGRLPAARRDALVERLFEDDDTARLQAEMERAQELALSLPRERVGAAFSETLWQRIRAGEGTPEAVFREPVSTATKLRYVAAGAVAAAALMFLLRPWLTPPADAAIPELHNGQPTVVADGVLTIPVAQDAEIPVDPPLVADAEAPTPTSGGLRPRRSLSPGAELVSLTPSNMARATQLGTYDAVHELCLSAPRLEERVGAVAPRDLVVELEPQIHRVRGLSDLLRWMQRENLATLPNDFDATLTLVERSVDRLELSRDKNEPRWLVHAVDDLKELDPRPLRQNFQVQCCIEPQDFLPQITQHFQTNPRALGAIRLVRADGLGFDVFSFRLDGQSGGIDPASLRLLIGGPSARFERR